MEAAHRLYYSFWGKDLDTHLKHKPDFGGFTYLPKEKIHYLQLRDWFNYSEDVLLIRNEYKVAYENFLSYHDSEDRKGGGVVVLGQAGIGMHPL